MTKKFDAYNGYQEKGFLENEVKLPALRREQMADLAPVDGVNDSIARYMNYSAMVSATRKFPYLTASNIDGSLFKKIPRVDRWRNDERIAKEHQWGKELYAADNSHFDKGHMTKREDTQWGETLAMAIAGADSTFFYTNSVPQHAKLNQRVWLSLEDYILHTEASDKGMKISVFTGPVLSKKDPLFLTKDGFDDVQIPMHFWKVVYFEKADGKLYRAGFMMSHSSLMYEHGIVGDKTEESFEEATEEDNLLNEFAGAETYQVNLSTIEKLTGFTFHPAIETYKDKRKTQLILEEIDIQESLNESAGGDALIGFSIKGLQL